MNRIRMKRSVNIDSLPFPTPQLTYDGLGRVAQLLFTYKSITVTYTATWIGVTNQLDTYTQTIQDVTL